MASLNLSEQELDFDVACLLQYPLDFLSRLVKWKLLLSWANGGDVTVYRRIFCPTEPVSTYNPLVLAILKEDLELLRFLCPLITQYYKKIARNTEVKSCLVDLFNDPARSAFVREMKSIPSCLVILREFKAQDLQRQSLEL
jgi:hypothetical protein